MEEETFYCISHYQGDLSYFNLKEKNNYIIYSKGDFIDSIYCHQVRVDNKGYNISSYLQFIVDFYDNLPERVFFCKNNLYPRHINLDVFNRNKSNKYFTPLEDPSRWDLLSYPVSLILNDGGYIELNNDWYVHNYVRKYFANYNSFYTYIFDTKIYPTYLRFAPGANYLVTKKEILKRSKSFYINLLNFVSHSEFSCESHFVERSLYAIWASNLNESSQMSKVLSQEDLNKIEIIASQNIKSESLFLLKFKRSLFNLTVRFLHNLIFFHQRKFIKY